MELKQPVTQPDPIERIHKAILDFSYRTENSRDLEEVKRAARQLRENLKSVKIKP